MFNQFFRGLRAKKKNPPVITTEGLMTTYRINMAIRYSEINGASRQTICISEAKIRKKLISTASN